LGIIRKIKQVTGCWGLTSSLLLGRQKTGGSRFKASQANSSQDPILKKNPSKKGLVEWLKVLGLEFKPQYCKKKFF
jgi:hypothetical protein